MGKDLGAVEAVSRRAKRVAQLIRQEVGGILVAELQDPRIGFVTLTRVEISADLRNARLFVSILGSEKQQWTALRGLNSARRRIRRALGERLQLRRVPEVSFEIDRGVKHSLKISGMLADLAAEREEITDVDTADEHESTRMTKPV